MAAAPQQQLVPFYVLSQEQVRVFMGKDRDLAPPRFKCFVDTGDIKREIWFHSKEQALRFRDMLTEIQFKTWNFEVKEEINIWKNM